MKIVFVLAKVTFNYEIKNYYSFYIVALNYPYSLCNIIPTLLVIKLHLFFKLYSIYLCPTVLCTQYNWNLYYTLNLLQCFTLIIYLECVLKFKTQKNISVVTHCHCVTWSVHHTHVASTVRPKSRPGHGRSPLSGSRNIWKASGRGRWHVVLGTVILGIAFPYCSSNPSYQPTLSNANKEQNKQKWELTKNRINGNNYNKKIWFIWTRFSFYTSHKLHN